MIAVGLACLTDWIALQNKLRLVCVATVECFLLVLYCFPSVIFLFTVDACASFTTEEHPTFDDVHIDSRGNGHNERAGQCMHSANYRQPGQCSCAIGIHKGCFYFDDVPGDRCKVFFTPNLRYTYFENYLLLVLMTLVLVFVAYELSAAVKKEQNKNVHLEEEVEMLIPTEVVEDEKPFAYL